MEANRPPTPLPVMTTTCPLPSFAPPGGVRLVTPDPHPCSYFPDRMATTRGLYTHKIDPRLYHQFMDANFRRSGMILYQPVCAGCRDCRQLRVPTARFAPSKTQRRVARSNADLSITTTVPSLTEEKVDLYRRYVRQWHGSADEPTEGQLRQFLYESPVQTIEMCYRTPDGRLVGVGICDICDDSLSTVYFYHDPEHRRRSLGVFSALTEIAAAKRLGIGWYYLGYLVAGCAKMEYKASYRPCEALDPDGVWRAVE